MMKNLYNTWHHPYRFVLILIHLTCYQPHDAVSLKSLALVWVPTMATPSFG